MRHVSSLEEASPTRPSALAIGVFDGVHQGHQELIAKLVQYAHDQALTPVVLTFYPNPIEIIKGPQPNFYLTPPGYKAQLLSDLGVEVVITYPFNEDARQIRAAAFLDLLVDNLDVKALWVGRDFAMGYQREGNLKFLQEQATQRGYTVHVIEDVADFEGRISSSKIRQMLAEGNVNEAANLLGRCYRLSGLVLEGDKRGRTIGFPTANLDLSSSVVIPANGVYAAWALVDGHNIPSAVNIGVRPTLTDSNTSTVEAHLIDYSGDLYGKTIALEFVARLRDEQKFNGLEELVAQISADVDKAREILATILTG